MIVGRSQISLWAYVARFIAIFVLAKAAIFIILMIDFLVWDVEFPLQYVWEVDSPLQYFDWMLAIACGESVGETIYRRNGVGLEGTCLLKLSGFCLLSFLIIEVIFTLVAILVDPSLAWFPKTTVEGVFSLFFPAIFIFWMIWFGFKWGFRTGEKKAAKRAAEAAEQSLTELLLSFEKQLLDPAVRRVRKKLERLLHVDFVEIGASGRTYDRQQVLDELPAEAHGYPTRTIEGFQIRELGEGLVQVFYDIAENGTRRTSIWMFAGHRWRMIYHQGTPRGS
ncbi:hypothetical protein PSE_5007 [Pseudovibrio sp. FO-BEG1]|uniref:nuclear transport factor 2 family protein n=1 Tax=Pseudovibrio sp. (strain FO-BEG1) TaxID=911045 RepID=UPI000238C18C|nr:nuclear transport factor 2 family protein [Pseudovibrio sp. FO-BEG1]AEV39509.1 hypothetical protein PSE_5007 [Pseudovibrio sp. FO-BEG1]